MKIGGKSKLTKIEIGSISVGKGEKAKGVFKIGELPDSSPINVPVMVVNGTGEGPNMWVQSAIHGEEVCGSFAIQRVFNELNPTELNGAFIGIPVMNISAFWVNSRGSPFEKLAHLDMNRVFPGKPDGTLTEQFAHAIYNQVKTHANYLIDFHSGHDTKTEWSLYPKVDNDASRESAVLVKYFGFPIILPSVADVLATSLFAVAIRDLNIPSIIIEAGGHGTTMGDELVDKSVYGIKNVMCYLKMIPGEPKLADKYYMLTDWAWMRATKGGFFQTFINANDKVSKGQHIATIYDIYGDEREKIVSPLDGIVLTTNKSAIILPGTSTFQIGKPSEE